MSMCVCGRFCTVRVWVLLGVAGLFCHLLLRGIFYASAGPDFWLHHAFIDDGFYYLQLAWSQSQGNGITMDGMNPTNGFHPLWFTVLVGLAVLAQSKMGLLFAAMWTSLLLFYISAVLFGWIMGKVFRSTAWGVSGFLLYLASPYLFQAHMNLLETGLLLMLKMAALCQILRMLENRQAVTRLHQVLLGVTCALIFLARVDSFVFIGAIVITAMAAQWKWSTELPRRQKASKAAGFLAVFSLPWFPSVVPWLAWNKIAFGSFIQVSAKMSCFRLLNVWKIFYDFDFVSPFYYYLHALENISLLIKACIIGFPLWLFAVVSILTLVSIRWQAPQPVRKNALLLWCIANLSLFVFFLVHFFGRNVGRPWYFIDIQWILCFAVLALAAGARRMWCSRGVLVLVLGLLATRWAPAHAGWYNAGAPDMNWSSMSSYNYLFKLAPALAEQGHCCVGHTDSGAYTFFAPPEITVVNLDGKVNNAAAAAIAGGTFSNYVLSSPVQLFHFLGPPFEAVMGRGYRKNYQFPIPLGARVLRSPGDVRKNVSLPKDGLIRPADHRTWQYLLGEWENCFDSRKVWCKGVRDIGVQFYLEKPVDLELELRVKPPQFADIKRHSLAANGNVFGAIKYDGHKPVTVRFSVPAGLLRAGFNEIAFVDAQPISPRMAGVNRRDGKVVTAEVDYFRLTPAGK